MMALALAILVAWAGPVGGPQVDPIEWLFVAIEAEEGWNGKDPMDDGLTDGPLGISRLYFEDGIWQLRKEGQHKLADRLEALGYPEAIKNLDNAKIVSRAFWRRWEPAAYHLAGQPISKWPVILKPGHRHSPFECLARSHNGGPQWRTKPPEVRARTAGYWRRVKAAEGER